MQRKLLLILSAVGALAMAGCDSEPDNTSEQAGAREEARTPQPEADVAPAPAAPGEDVHSHANPHQVLTRHLDLELDVDFDSRVIDGTVTLGLERIDPGADLLILDTRELQIEAVTSGGNDLQWTLGRSHEALGTALEITLPAGADSVTVDYRTAPTASGLQWLDPVQTAGGEHPFLFTQAQAIHARSFIPLQDTPQVRVTFDAVIRTPRALRAVMGAANDLDAERDGEFHFEMPQPIPSYLIAFGVGDLEFRSMSERTGVFAEPSLVEAAAAEFSDTEQMMKVTEALYGPYRWGRYDLLILPPSFPFGGMENPRLSFITPTIIAGDKSLVALIAHELAHSWSGNLVTNATWKDLWLNEGFTVYLEARIMEAVFGERRRRMEDVLGYQSLLDDFEDVPTADQRLAPDLRGRDPDDAFSNVPYEKGRLLLVYLEDRFGRETFDAFLRQYFEQFAFESLTTEEFLDYLDAHLLSAYPGKVDLATVEQWIREPGLPEDAVLPASDAFTKVDRIRESWVEGEIDAAELPVENWTVHEWLYFLNNMPDQLDAAKLPALDTAHNLTGSTNAEIAHSWLRLAVEHRYEPAMPRLREYLVSIGRRKLIVPLYEDLMATDWGKPMAKEIYAEARPGYHPLAQNTLDAVVK